MVVRYITLKVVTYDEFDDSFWDDSGKEVDVEQSVCNAWNDIQADYHNFSLEKYDKTIISEILEELERYQKEGIEQIPISKVRYYFSYLLHFE